MKKKVILFAGVGLMIAFQSCIVCKSPVEQVYDCPGEEIGKTVPLSDTKTGQSIELFGRNE